MKRKLHVLLAIVMILSLSVFTACGGDETVDNKNSEDKVTEAPAQGEVDTPATETPTLTEDPAATEVPDPTEVPEPTATPTPTVTPVPTSTLAPTSTPAPTATLKPTATPTPTATPEPTATPVPTATPAPTATPKPTATPTPEPKQYNRDASHVIKGTRSDGTAIEVVIEYDSSIVSYETKYNENMGWIVNGRELPTGEVTYMCVLDDSKMGPFGYPMIQSGCTSYENYKKDFLKRWTDKGALNPDFLDYESVTVNGYTYYFGEGFFMTSENIGDPDILYVQVGENEYLEFYNLMFEESLEELVNTSLYIKEVR